MLKGSLALSFDSSAVLDMSGVALITMLIHAEMVTPDDVYQFLNLTTLATRNCSQVIVPSVINSEPDSVDRNVTSVAGSSSNLAEHEHNSTDVLNSTDVHHQSLPSTVIPGVNVNVTSDLTQSSDSNAFWSDVLSFLSGFWDVLADILHQLGQVLMDPQPSAPFVVVALTSLLCLLVLGCLLWRCLRNLYRFLKWLCCLCHHQVSDDLPPPAAQSSDADPGLELAALDHALANIDQEQPPFAADLQVEAADGSDIPAPLAVSEEFDYIPAPPPPPPSSPSKSFATTMV